MKNDKSNDSAPGYIRYYPVISNDLQIHVHTQLKQAFEQLATLDAILVKYAKALDVVQPNAPGRITIAFLQVKKNHMGSRTPVFIRWYKSRTSGKWLYEQLQTSKVVQSLKTYPAFRTTHEDTKEVLEAARHVLKMRQSLDSEIGNLRKRLGNHVAQTAASAITYSHKVDEWMPKLINQREMIIAAHREDKQEIKEMLDAETYVDERTIPRT